MDGTVGCCFLFWIAVIGKLVAVLIILYHIRGLRRRRRFGRVMACVILAFQTRTLSGAECPYLSCHLPDLGIVPCMPGPQRNWQSSLERNSGYLWINDVRKPETLQALPPVTGECFKSFWFLNIVDPKISRISFQRGLPVLAELKHLH